MSSPSIRLYSAKSYGRPRDTSSRSFDEMMNTKETKSSSAHTKWGNTNYIALRGRKKKEEGDSFENMDSKTEKGSVHTKWGSTRYAALKGGKNKEGDATMSKQAKTIPEDPFSFDTDEKGKSPTKVQSRLITDYASASIESSPSDILQRNKTRLPASRIFTRGHDIEIASSSAVAVDLVTQPDSPTIVFNPIMNKLFSQGNWEEDSNSGLKLRISAPSGSESSSVSLCAIARPGRTYTHSSDGRIRCSPTKRPLDQHADVGQNAKRDLQADVVYAPESHKLAQNLRYATSSHSSYKNPQNSSSASSLLDGDACKSPPTSHRVDYSSSSSSCYDAEDILAHAIPYRQLLLGSSYPRDSQAHVNSSSPPGIKRFRMGSDGVSRPVADYRAKASEDQKTQCKNTRMAGTWGRSVLGNQQVSEPHCSLNSYQSKVDDFDDDDIFPKAAAPPSPSRLSVSSRSSGRWLSDCQESNSGRSAPFQAARFSVENENCNNRGTALTRQSRDKAAEQLNLLSTEEMFDIDKPSSQSNQSSAEDFSVFLDDKSSGNMLIKSKSGKQIFIKDRAEKSYPKDRAEDIFPKGRAEDIFVKERAKDIFHLERAEDMFRNDRVVIKKRPKDIFLMGRAEDKDDEFFIKDHAEDKPAVKGRPAPSSLPSFQVNSSKSASSKNSSFSGSAGGGKTTTKRSNCRMTPRRTTGSSNTASSRSGIDSAGTLKRLPSGVKQYRIFKSRRPAQPSPEEPEEAEDDPVVSVRSPTMPELDLELPVPFDQKGNVADMQQPPDLTDHDDDADACSVEENVFHPDAGNEPQRAHADGEAERVDNIAEAERVVDNNIEFFSTSPAQEAPACQPAEPRAAFEAPSPASVSSQEQDAHILSTTSMQKSNAPAAPRRFFKSRKQTATGPQPKSSNKGKKFSYNARSWQQDEQDNEVAGSISPAEPRKEANIFQSDEDEVPTSSIPSRRKKRPLLTRTVNWSLQLKEASYTSVHVPAKHKQLYTVVQNVKMAHEVQESGETQDFIDDLEYLLDNLKKNQTMSIRSLSTIQLAGKCSLPAFRMHLRAHGTVTKIFSLLHDAADHPSLALSTAALMLMLSQDRLNMDLDRDSLQLMLRLSQMDMVPHVIQDIFEEDSSLANMSAEDRADLEKCQSRVQELLIQLQKESSAVKRIDIDNITTGDLALDCLLSFSRRGGEWCKEQLRSLSGLDQLILTVHHNVGEMNEEIQRKPVTYTPILKKLNRVLRVLENVTFMDEANQAYVNAWSDGMLVKDGARLLHQCVQALPLLPMCETDNVTILMDQPGWIVHECLQSCLKVLLNMTHECEFGCAQLGEQPMLLPSALQCAVNLQWCLTIELRFDMLILSLGLLMNLMFMCPANRRRFLRACLVAQVKEDVCPVQMSATRALVQLFLERAWAARQMEESYDSPNTASTSRAGGSASGSSWRSAEAGIDWITRSAEIVRAAEQQLKDQATVEGSSNQEKAPEQTGQEDDENFTKALRKAGKHMENSIVASYIGLVLGCVVQDNKKYANIVKSYIPGSSFNHMVEILKKFLGFMTLTTALGTTGAKSIQRVIDFLEAC